MKKILLVDDDADLREAMKTVLSGTYEVREADNKNEGLSLVKDFRPDLVLLDVMMESDSAGIELAREIKNSPDLGQTKILMITSIDSALAFDFKAAAGDPAWLPVDGYINKPVHADDLVAKIKAMMDQ
jgi:CheY-like chemotaxis protein